MTLRLTDEQTETLRDVAAADGRSMQQTATSAVERYIARRIRVAAVRELATGSAASLTNHQALVDGTKRTAWLATVVFLRLNGCRVTAPDAYDGIAARTVLMVASGELRDLSDVRATLGRMVDQAP